MPHPFGTADATQEDSDGFTVVQHGLKRNMRKQYKMIRQRPKQCVLPETQHAKKTHGLQKHTESKASKESRALGKNTMHHTMTTSHKREHVKECVWISTDCADWSETPLVFTHKVGCIAEYVDWVKSTRPRWSHAFIPSRNIIVCRSKRGNVCTSFSAEELYIKRLQQNPDVPAELSSMIKSHSQAQMEKMKITMTKAPGPQYRVHVQG